MKRTIIIVMGLALILIAVSNCGGGSNTSEIKTAFTQMPGTAVGVEGGGTYWTITVTELKGITPKDYYLVDSDSTYAGELQGTDLFIRPEELSKNISKFPTDKSTKIVAYCNTGVKSQDMAAALVKEGYTRVMQLKGGLIEWQKEGYAILYKSQTSTERARTTVGTLLPGESGGD